MAKLSKVQQKLKKINEFNARLKRYKYIHLMFNDKFADPVVKFFNQYFDPEEHLFLCKQIHAFPFPTGNNVIKVDSFKHINCDSKTIEKVLCHSLFDKELVQILYDSPTLLSKAYWIVWGGDLHNAPRDEVNDYVRSNMKGYIICQIGDGKIIKERYQCKNNSFCRTGYSTPISLDLVNQVKLYLKNNPPDHPNTVIQVNNSSDRSTLEILDTLAKFKDKNIIVRTPLSYGDPSCIVEILKKGTELFGEKFQYLSKYLPAKDYTFLLSEVDVYIFNQSRPQGIGNCAVALLLGSKIFIRSEINTYKMLSPYLTIYDTNTLSTLTFEELISYPQSIKDDNIKKAESFYTDQSLKEAWSHALAMP